MVRLCTQCLQLKLMSNVYVPVSEIYTKNFMVDNSLYYGKISQSGVYDYQILIWSKSFLINGKDSVVICIATGHKLRYFVTVTYQGHAVMGQWYLSVYIVMTLQILNSMVICIATAHYVVTVTYHGHTITRYKYLYIAMTLQINCQLN